MGIKKRGITLSIFILLIALGVQAQPILPELSDFYLENQPVFDFLLFFMIIGGVARIVFEKRFGESKGTTALWVGIGALLSASGVYSEVLSVASFAAVFKDFELTFWAVVFLLLLMFFYHLMRQFTDSKPLAAILTLFVASSFLYVFFPRVQEITPGGVWILVALTALLGLYLLYKLGGWASGNGVSGWNILGGLGRVFGGAGKLGWQGLKFGGRGIKDVLRESLNNARNLTRGAKGGAMWLLNKYSPQDVNLILRADEDAIRDVQELMRKEAEIWKQMSNNLSSALQSNTASDNAVQNTSDLMAYATRIEQELRRIKWPGFFWDRITRKYRYSLEKLASSLLEVVNYTKQVGQERVEQEYGMLTKVKKLVEYSLKFYKKSLKFYNKRNNYISPILSDIVNASRVAGPLIAQMPQTAQAAQTAGANELKGLVEKEMAAFYLLANDLSSLPSLTKLSNLSQDIGTLWKIMGNIENTLTSFGGNANTKELVEYKRALKEFAEYLIPTMKNAESEQRQITPDEMAEIQKLEKELTRLFIDRKKLFEEIFQ